MNWIVLMTNAKHFWMLSTSQKFFLLLDLYILLVNGSSFSPIISLYLFAVWFAVISPPPFLTFQYLSGVTVYFGITVALLPLAKLKFSLQYCKHTDVLTEAVCLQVLLILLCRCCVQLHPVASAYNKLSGFTWFMDNFQMAWQARLQLSHSAQMLGLSSWALGNLCRTDPSEWFYSSREQHYSNYYCCYRLVTKTTD